MSFGNIIEERRKYLQIRQEDLAELCNVSSKSIQKIFHALIAALVTRILQSVHVKCEYSAERVPS